MVPRPLVRALAQDLGRVTIVVMTEFDRRAYENGSLGTDHGRASVMLALGAGVRGGRIYGRWPGLTGRACSPGSRRSGWECSERAENAARPR